MNVGSFSKLALACVIACAAGTISCSKDEPAAPAPAPDGGDVTPVTYDFSAMRDVLFGGAWKTEGVVVMRDGKIVFEQYAAGYDENKRHIAYSVSKSVGSALVGIAIADGLLKLEDSVCKTMPAPAGADPALCDTTIEHAVRMSSGLKWAEEYENDPTESNVLRMLYGDEADMGEYVALQPRDAPAGQRWQYSSGDSNLLARALRGALGGKDMRAWAKEKLFDPAGMKSPFFEVDRSGTLLFSSACYMSTRDMAKFGQLYLDDGMAGATRVLPSSWVTYTHTPAPPVAQPRPNAGSYGAAFWLNAASPTATADTFSYSAGPVDMYMAEGHWGQKIFIIPSRKMIIARVGNDRTPIFDPNPMIEKAILADDMAHKGGN
ncbi:MAG: serine hydrolase [Labilithrix sp.]|nr:serine hydrolase [Labilithrix sp.]